MTPRVVGIKFTEIVSGPTPFVYALTRDHCV
jgi:hypothetical protein